MILTHTHIILQFITIYLYIIVYMYAVSHLFIVDLHILTRQVEAEEKITPKKTGRFTPRIITPSAVEDTPALHKKGPTKWAKTCVKMKSIQKGPKSMKGYVQLLQLCRFHKLNGSHRQLPVSWVPIHAFGSSPPPTQPNQHLRNFGKNVEIYADSIWICWERNHVCIAICSCTCCIYTRLS